MLVNILWRHQEKLLKVEILDFLLVNNAGFRSSCKAFSISAFVEARTLSEQNRRTAARKLLASILLVITADMRAFWSRGVTLQCLSLGVWFCWWVVVKPSQSPQDHVSYISITSSFQWLVENIWSKWKQTSPTDEVGGVCWDFGEDATKCCCTLHPWGFWDPVHQRSPFWML